MEMTLTAHEKTELARCAKSFELRGYSNTAQYINNVSNANSCPLSVFDAAKGIYRSWLVFGEHHETKA